MSVFLRRLETDPTLRLGLGAVLTLAGAILVAVILVVLVRMLRTSVVARLPVRGEHAFDLAAAGGYALHLEGPLLGRLRGGPLLIFGVAVGGPRLSIREEATGADVAMGAGFGARSSGFSRSRQQIRTFQAPRPGRYVLASLGLDEQRDFSDWAFLVTKPYAGRMTLLLLAVFAGAITLMAGVTLVGWWALERAGI